MASLDTISEKSKHYSYTSAGEDGRPYGYAELVCDAIADLDYLPILKSDIAVGSQCFCIEDGKTYILSNEREWVVAPDSGAGAEITGAQELSSAVEQGGVGWKSEEIIYTGMVSTSLNVNISPAKVVLMDGQSYTFKFGDTEISGTATYRNRAIIWPDTEHPDYYIWYAEDNDYSYNSIGTTLAEPFSGDISLVEVHKIDEAFLPDTEGPLVVNFSLNRLDNLICDHNYAEIVQAISDDREIIAKLTLPGEKGDRNVYTFRDMRANHFNTQAGDTITGIEWGGAWGTQSVGVYISDDSSGYWDTRLVED